MTWLEDEPFRGGYPTIEFLALTGVERMRAAAKGLMPRPPIHHLFGLTPQSASVASSVFSMPASPWLQSGAGVFLAGTAALVADAPLGSAILGPLGPGQVVVTSDLTLNYLRPTSTRSQRLTGRARPIEVGRRLGLAEAVIEDGAGEVVAHATTRCFIREFPVPEKTELPPIEERQYDTPDPYLRELTTSLIPREAWAEKSFVEICELTNSGELPTPPFSKLFGITDTSAKEGYFESTAPSSPWFTSPAGTIYGGFLAYFADAVLTGAMNTVLPPNSIPAALDLKVNFLRPVMPDGRPITATATVVHRGRTLLLAEGQITNADGKVVVKASSSATVITGHSWSAAVIDETPAPDA
ncbi:MAG TPA: PaaI family thioesterase [Actinomycetota bacterium]|nr:PaaI family thioesterase [Actinomycetota bacterium]